MADQPAPAPAPPPNPPEVRPFADDLIEGGVMSFGDHLDELRRCCIRALVAIAITTALAMYFADELMAFLLQPAVIVLFAHGQRPEMQALSPPDAFLTYFKIAMLSGLILSMPFVLWEFWRFVALGLYPREKKFVRAIAPVSLGLFAAGVMFMFFLVLPVVLNFFVRFGEQIKIASLKPSFIQGLVVGEPAEKTDPAELALPESAHVALLPGNPPNPPVGSIWFNSARGVLCVQAADGLRMLPTQPAERVTAVRSEFGLNYYLSFVLSLSLAFGLAFELPLVIIFLTVTGIVSTGDLTKWRRYVILGIFIVAAVLTPPDVISQLLLATPMLVLFEGALYISKVLERRRVATMDAG
jgi:sec-independent protein translocase protein TatC